MVETDQPAVTTPCTPDEQQDLPNSQLGVLQKVQYLRIGHTDNLILLYASFEDKKCLLNYCISQMGNDQQVRVFQTLVGEPRFAAVLQFYAGFRASSLINVFVYIITGSDFQAYSKSSKLSLLSHIRCFFASSKFMISHCMKKIILRLNATLDLPTSQLESTRLHVSWILPGICSQEQ